MKLTFPKPSADRGCSIGPRKPQLEVSERYSGTSFGGLASIKSLSSTLELDKNINEHVSLLKVRRGYAESDHVLAMAYNIFHGGQTLDDVERMRGDQACLDMLDASSISDPTTLGDFCRRFTSESCWSLQDGINQTRLNVWKCQPSSFFKRATIDADGVVTETGSECSEGVEYNGHKKIWGYHPLVVSLAETSEPLFIVNRPGARPSHEGAHSAFDKSISLCQKAGFESIVLRGDTDFSQTKYLDGWDKEGVGFVFGMDAHQGLVSRAEEVNSEDWELLTRKSRDVPEEKQRRKQHRFKDDIVFEKGYRNLELEREDIAEVAYSPQACQKQYRLIILRKTIRVNRGAELLMPEVRYFFYISNLSDHSPREIVKEANDRCNQENLNSHLKRGVHALRAPLKTTTSNWAYMIATALAWSLKAWFALMGSFEATSPQSQQAVRRKFLTMEFRTFFFELICIPSLVIKKGRQMIVRFLSRPPCLGHLLSAHQSFRE